MLVGGVGVRIVEGRQRLGEQEARRAQAGGVRWTVGPRGGLGCNRVFEQRSCGVELAPHQVTGRLPVECGTEGLAGGGAVRRRSPEQRGGLGEGRLGAVRVGGVEQHRAEL
jgi:hypothetical protein